MDNWIPVAERLPEHGVDVLYYWHYKKKSVWWYSEPSREWFHPKDVDETTGIEGPTHWQPLPEPPEAE